MDWESQTYTSFMFCPFRYSRLVDWCRNREKKQWVGLEQEMVDAPLKRLPWYIKTRDLRIKKYTPVDVTLRMCLYAFKELKLSTFPSPLYPIIVISDFHLGKVDDRFKILKELDY